ncbi:Predicted O-linked N-acetylglucosamine transferase, SPINDLY family [Arboricoccus pini]|uniref:protein O-GlcNAc transferase n=1 Tax=Arboricoccus pini TaxID=1963835 RepID=A0A212S240_9PROT|nr:tetratricopeptide repeat protein [Arboricoccus pini]SNB79178.1 Predicted O-linked N-acetylglucosamine transferase, SPINDLY family [Arboricoccus pini]
MSPPELASSPMPQTGPRPAFAAVLPPGPPTSFVEELLHDALAHHQAGNLTEAERFYRAVLDREPRQPDALHLLGLCLAAVGRVEEGISSVRRLLAFWPDDARPHFLLGNLLAESGQAEQAVLAYDTALALDADGLEARVNRANVLQQLQRFAEALEGYDQVLAAGLRLGSVLSSRGNVLHALGRHEEALLAHDEAVATAPGDGALLSNRGIVLVALGRLEQARECYEQALAALPSHPALLTNLGNVLHDLERFAEAKTCYERALAVAPEDPTAWTNLGTALESLGRVGDALACYVRSLELRPASTGTLSSLGNLLVRLKRHDDAALIFARLVELAPDHDYAQGSLLAARLRSCDWQGYDELLERTLAGIDAGRPVALPFVALLWSRGPQDDLRVAEATVRRRHPARPPLWRGQRYRHERIRLAYVGTVFNDHVTAQLMAGVFEQHDRDRFETLAISFGPDSQDPLQDRVRSAFERFVDVRAMGVSAIARLMHEMEIDIAVDLNGHTADARLDIFAHRPAPLQVNYLSYPGTLGAPYLDYLIADRHIVPPADEACYSEQVARLPFSYQPNDDKRVIAAERPTRAQCGLPEDAFVFCSFNNAAKLNPAMFEAWMDLLRDTPNSVLWLLRSNETVALNLRREASARSVAPERLVFAPFLAQAQNLARLGLADLFLDSLPFNAHTTASDALWAGVPLLTCTGTNFAGRVATGVLHALDLPELVTDSLEAYLALANQLATQPRRLNALKARLRGNRQTAPLFNTSMFTRHLEAAYQTMWQRHEQGLPPKSFDVPA